MTKSKVIFKGTVNGLTIVLKEDDKIEDILFEVEEKIKSAGKFFKGAILNVKYKGKKLNSVEQELLQTLLIKKSGAEIKSFSEEEEVMEPAAEHQAPPKPFKRMSNFFFKGIEEGPAKFHKGTLRSGQMIDFDGNLVVIGDVNPGAQVIATGNIVVIGNLKGLVHAGSDGNRNAVVVALNLQPMQLRISDIITRSPDEKPQEEMLPEIAYIKDNMVYIDRLPNYIK